MKKLLFIFSIISISTLSSRSFAEEDATIALKFDSLDGKRLVHAIIQNDTIQFAEVDVSFYIKRLFADFQIGEYITTDESGIATCEFPQSIPGDSLGNVIVIARTEDDEQVGSIEGIASIAWGTKLIQNGNNGTERALSASRSYAPWFLIISSLLIIGLVWFVLFYVISILFKIKNAV